jgi:hypothetical protein
VFARATTRMERTIGEVEATGGAPAERSLFLQAEAFYRYRFEPPRRGGTSFLAEAAAALSSIFPSNTFAPVMRAANGTPRASARMCRFTPRLPRSVGLRPVRSPLLAPSPSRCRAPPTSTGCRVSCRSSAAARRAAAGTRLPRTTGETAGGRSSPSRTGWAAPSSSARIVAIRRGRALRASTQRAPGDQDARDQLRSRCNSGCTRHDFELQFDRDYSGRRTRWWFLHEHRGCDDEHARSVDAVLLQLGEHECMTRSRDPRERVRHRADRGPSATDRRPLQPPWRWWPARSSTRCWPAYGS